MADTAVKINGYIMKVFEIVAAICIVVIIIATSIQVFTRYVLSSSMVGTEELARFCFIWATMLGASICVNHEAHAVVSFLPDKLKGKIKTNHAYLIQAFIIMAAGILIVQGVKMLGVTWNQLSPTLNVPMWIVYLAIPIGGIGIFMGAINNIIKIYRNAKGEVSK